MLAPQSIEEPIDMATKPLLARSMESLLNGDGSGQRQPVIDQRAALMIYTSGTTGRPKGELFVNLPFFRLITDGLHPQCKLMYAKENDSMATLAGVVHTHGTLAAQMDALCAAWGWSESDRILHALPLHHIHGAVVALHTAHAAGACVEFLPKFSPSAVWGRLMVRAFMGVAKSVSVSKSSMTSRGLLSADAELL